MRDDYYLTSETGCRCDCCSASVAQRSAPKARQPGRGGWWRAGWWPMGRAARGKLGANPWCARLQQRPFSLSLFLALNSLTLFFFLLNILAVRLHYISSRSTAFSVCFLEEILHTLPKKTLPSFPSFSSASFFWFCSVPQIQTLELSRRPPNHS